MVTSMAKITTILIPFLNHHCNHTQGTNGYRIFAWRWECAYVGAVDGWRLGLPTVLPGVCIQAVEGIVWST